MINRELTRLKVLQLVYAYSLNGGKSLGDMESELSFSIDKAYDLYLYLLSILVALRQVAEKQVVLGQVHLTHMASDDPGKPDMEAKLATAQRFAENALLKQLTENAELSEFCQKRKADWEEEIPIVKRIYEAMTESSGWQLYMSDKSPSYEADREIVRKLYKQFVCHNEDLDSMLEDHSLYWNDDKEIVDSFVLKTIKRFKAESSSEEKLLPKYGADEDREFGTRLLRATLSNSQELLAQIDHHVNKKKWDLSRIAGMDLVILQIALAEILEFDLIPLEVSLNEYVDLASLYSTPKSARFVNGMLGGIVQTLRTQGLTNK